ncbi:MAG TPA: ribosome maturation factor RimM [Bacilli bacterium]|nr:ribosome maturation factor RimM [Bacilli bacterium]
MNNELIKIGAIIATRGLAGEVKVFPTTDFIDERFYVGAKVFLSERNEVKALVTIAAVVLAKGILNVKFVEVNHIIESEKLLRYDVVIKKSDAKLPKGYIFDEELMGLDVYTTENVYVGKISEIMTYTPEKTLRIKRENKSDVLVPILPVFVKSTDLAAKKMTIEFIEGML